MQSDDASISVRRFGLGPRPGDLSRVSGDPRGYVLAQLEKPGLALLAGQALAATPRIFSAVQAVQFERSVARAMTTGETPGTTGAERAAGPKTRQPSASSDIMGSPDSVARPSPSDRPAPIDALKAPRDFLLDEQAARIERMRTTETPLLERLVSFWSNHFAISALKGQQVLALAGAFERETIRPHVLGRFADMLKSVEQHPAMLIYLDNQLSIGPNSQAGRNRGRGLNENLAREILELHTLGVKGGYTQADVTNLARLITGWTVAGVGAAERSTPGTFRFTPNRHEPGQITLLGNPYGGKGQASGEEALMALARHPATARHIAMKLASHFVSAETPPPRLVATLERTFSATDGDLAAVTRALVTADEVWSTPPKKITPPVDFAVSLARGFSLTMPATEIIRIAAALGQPLWRPQSPKGWTDDDHAWIGPSAVRERLRIAEKIAREIDKAADPRELARDLIGAAISEPSLHAIARAETREQALEILVMTPEFQRR